VELKKGLYRIAAVAWAILSIFVIFIASNFYIENYKVFSSQNKGYVPVKINNILTSYDFLNSYVYNQYAEYPLFDVKKYINDNKNVDEFISYSLLFNEVKFFRIIEGKKQKLTSNISNINELLKPYDIEAVSSKKILIKLINYTFGLIMALWVLFYIFRMPFWTICWIIEGFKYKEKNETT